MINEANTLIFEEHDLITLDNIPDWLTGYFMINPATQTLHFYNGTSSIEALAYKQLFSIKLLGYEPVLNDMADAFRFVQELGPDGSVSSPIQIHIIPE